MHYSEVGQDIFALETAKHKSYIEIGGAYPHHINNTFLLEQNGWTGYSIELDQKYEVEWHHKRKNKIYFEDAVTFIHPTQSRIGYLSCDINPPDLTFLALKNVIEQGIHFDCITFEHDEYMRQERNYPNICNKTKKYLLSVGYKIAVDNVYTIRRRRINNSKKKYPQKCYFETWYVNNDLEFNYSDYEDWKNDKQLLYKL